MSVTALEATSCLVCENVDVKIIEFETNTLSICPNCGFSERVYSSSKVKNFCAAKSTVEETYYLPTLELEKCAQNKGYKFSGVSNSWMPMEKWGRWIGKAGRATITFQLAKPIEEDAILKLLLIMPDGHLPSPLVLTLEDREVLQITLSESTEYYFEFQIPNGYIAEKTKIDLNIYCEKLTKDEQGRSLSVGVKDIALGVVSDNLVYSNIQFNDETIPFVSEIVQFRNKPNSLEFESTIAEILSGNLSCYPPEEFGIWLNSRNCQFKILVPNATSSIELKLASPVLQRKGIVTVNGKCKTEFSFDENFIGVKIELDGLIAKTNQLMLDIFIEFDQITNMSELGSADERDISAGIAAIHINKD